MFFGTLSRPVPIALSLEQLAEFVLRHPDEVFVIRDTVAFAECFSTTLRLRPTDAEVVRISIEVSCWVEVDLLADLIRSAQPESVCEVGLEARNVERNAEILSSTSINRSKNQADRDQNRSFRDQIQEMLDGYERLRLVAEELIAEANLPRDPEYRLTELSDVDKQEMHQQTSQFVRNVVAERNARGIVDPPIPTTTTVDSAEIHTDERLEVPLGVGTRLRGGVALANLRSSEDRPRLRIDPTRRKELEEKAYLSYEAASRILWGSADTRDCFQWDDDQCVQRNERGYPQAKKSIRGWLNKVGSRLVDRMNVQVPIPRNPKGELILHPEPWGMWAACDRSLWAWRELFRAAELIRLSQTIEGGASPKYEGTPFLRSYEPNLTAYRRQRARVFRPSTGHVFIGVRLSELRLRCFAAIGIRQGYFPWQRCRLLNYLLKTDDPIATMAEELYIELFVRERPGRPNVAPPQPIRVDEEVRAGKQDKADERNAAARHAAEESFLQLQKQGGKDYEDQLRRIVGLLDAAILGVPDSWLENFLDNEHGVSAIATSEATRMIELISERIVPELGAYRADRTRDLVWARLDRSSQDEVITRANAEFPDSEAARIRNVLQGSGLGGLGLAADVYPGPNVGAGTTQLDADAIAQPATLFKYRGRTLGGGVTTRGTPPIVRQLEILHSADEILMDAAFALVSRSHRLIGIADSELVVEVPEGEAHSHATTLQELVQVASARLLGRLSGPVRLSECDEW
jgi:hypothetical protein